MLGLVFKPVLCVEGACVFSALVFREVVFVIVSGFYDIVLVGGFEDMSKCFIEQVVDGLVLVVSFDEWVAGFTFFGVFGAVVIVYFQWYGAICEHL